MGKQGGELKWWSSSTVLLDPAAFVENWKRQIQGKDGIPAEHQRLIFACRVATQEGLSSTCKRSSRCPRARERAATEFVKELRSWKAELKSDTHVICTLLRPLVAAEDDKIASHLYCQTARELREIGIPCNVYYLFFDKLEAPQEKDKCYKATNSLNIQIDKDFQSKSFQIDLFGRLNGRDLPQPFIYRMNGGEVAAQMSMHEQTAKYRQGHQMRHRLGLSTQSVGKGVEGRDVLAAMENDRSVNGYYGSEHPADHHIRCGKGREGLEVTAHVSKDHPHQLKRLVLTVIQVPVNPLKRPDQLATRGPAFQPVCEGRCEASKAGLQKDANRCCVLSPNGSSHKSEILFDSHKTTGPSESPVPFKDSVHNASHASDVSPSPECTVMESKKGDGKVRDGGTGLSETCPETSPGTQEAGVKTATKKKKKKKGRRNTRSAIENMNTVSPKVKESVHVATGDSLPSNGSGGFVGNGSDHIIPHDYPRGSLEKVHVGNKRFSHVKQDGMKMCTGEDQDFRGEVSQSLHGETWCRLTSSMVRYISEGCVLEKSSQAIEGIQDDLLGKIPQDVFDLKSEQTRFALKKESKNVEILDMIANATHMEEDTKDAGQGCSNVTEETSSSSPSREKSKFRNPLACGTSPHHTVSTSNGLSERLNLLHVSGHENPTLMDWDSEDSSTSAKLSGCCEGSHLPLRELVGNVEVHNDSKEQVSYSDSKVSARGGQSTSGAGGRNGRGSAEGSSNRSCGRGSEDRRGTNGYHGGGQGSSGSGHGSGPGGSGMGGGSGGSGGNGNRGGGSSADGWDGRSTDNNGGTGSKEGDGDERHRPPFQTGSNGEAPSDSSQRKKALSPLEHQLTNARKMTIGAGEVLSNGISNSVGTIASTSGTGKENLNSYWQKVQKPCDGEEIAEPEEMMDVLGPSQNNCRTESDEVMFGGRVDLRFHPSSTHLKGHLQDERSPCREDALEHMSVTAGDDSYEQGSMLEDLGMVVKPSMISWLIDHDVMSSSSLSRHARDFQMSGALSGQAKGSWQRKLVSEDSQPTHKVASEGLQHVGPSRGQVNVRQLSVRSLKNGALVRGQISETQFISHTRSFSAPSTPHDFEDNFSENGDLSYYQQTRQLQVVSHQPVVSGTARQIEQAMSQGSHVRPQSNNTSSLVQPGEAKSGSDDAVPKMLSWKGRKVNGEQERPAPREKFLGDRERSTHCAQKWVPVEPKSGGLGKGFNSQLKSSTNVPIGTSAENISRESKEEEGDVVDFKQRGVIDNGSSCSSSPSKSSRQVQTLHVGSKRSDSEERAAYPIELSVDNQVPSGHVEQANLRNLLPKERIVDSPLSHLGPSMDSPLGRMSVKPELMKSLTSSERKCFVKSDETHRESSGAFRPDLLPEQKEIREAAKAVLDAVYVSCRNRGASERVAQMVGCPMAQFEKVLIAVAPSFVPEIPTPDSVSFCRGLQEFDSSCISGFEGAVMSKESCSSREDDVSISRFGLSNTPLSSVWQWFEEPSYYGVEVRALDSQRAYRDGGDDEQFLAYYVPYLSGLQLFGHSSHLENDYRSRVEGASISVKPVSSPNSQPRSFSGMSVLATLFPTPGKVDESNLHQWPDYCPASGQACPSTRSESPLDVHLIYEFFDADQPQMRQPLFPKVKDLMKGVTSLNSHSSGSATALENLSLGDIHPASWFAVAWYPIYRISEGPLRAVFLTYHSFNHFTPTSRLFCATSGGADIDDTSSISLPVVGLECYNIQAEPWLSMVSSFKEASKNMERFPVNPAQCLDDRISSLKAVAAVMAKGIPHGKALSSADSSSSSSNHNSSSGSSKFKHSDYEFFLKRRR